MALLVVESQIATIPEGERILSPSRLNYWHTIGLLESFKNNFGSSSFQFLLNILSFWLMDGIL